MLLSIDATRAPQKPKNEEDEERDTHTGNTWSSSNPAYTSNSKNRSRASNEIERLFYDSTNHPHSMIPLQEVSLWSAKNDMKDDGEYQGILCFGSGFLSYACSKYSTSTHFQNNSHDNHFGDIGIERKHRGEWGGKERTINLSEYHAARRLNFLPQVETSLCAYIENFRNYDEFSRSPHPAEYTKSSGARFLLDVESHLRHNVFAIDGIVRLLSIQPHHGRYLKNVTRSAPSHNSEQCASFAYLSSILRKANETFNLKPKILAKGKNIRGARGDEYQINHSVLSNRVGTEEVYIDTTAHAILLSAFKWLRRKARGRGKARSFANHEYVMKTKESKRERSFIVLPSAMSLAARYFINCCHST